jgi:prepilin-type N-terminal cleavage/methylation domain-containing protein
MRSSLRLSCRRRHARWHSFTLIELLVVMAIISILIGLTLAASNGVFAQASRKRAAGEIQAISTALDGYKVDNGGYPQSSSLTLPYATDPSPAGGAYQLSSAVIYLALSGQTNFLDTPVAGNKVYLPGLKRNQVGDAAAGSYLMDPFKYSYGYSTGTTAIFPNNGSGFFDVWSTGGNKGATPANISGWICNWQ